jgi:5-formyltetrahydrofolate cyclo-ligase
MKTKDDIRHDIRIRRAQLTLEEIGTRSRAAIGHLQQTELLQNAEKVACYLSKPFEVQTQRFIETCLTSGKKVCVPRHIDDRLGYAWSWVKPGGAWRDGPWRIAEPAHYVPVDVATLSLAIVPAVAVDAHGHRLGHGGGNFDRLLREVKAPHVALVFDFQLIDAVPVEVHDVPVNLVVSDTGVQPVTA